jgi:predicted  nucleic acid-binding Zn-ribbon protein
MKEKLIVLINLQKIETEKESIQKALSAIPEKSDALDAEVIEFEKKLTDETAVLDELKKEYRSHELAVRENFSKITKSKERLNAIKTNKEYQAMLKEIEDIETKNSEIEDVMMGYLEQIETKEKYVAAVRKEGIQLRDRITKEKEKIHKEQVEGGKKLSQLESQSESLSKRADPDMLYKYKKVKNRVFGSVIVPVVNAVCGGCNMNIPAQLYNELYRFDTLRFCPFCYRMIYVDIETE